MSKTYRNWNEYDEGMMEYQDRRSKAKRREERRERRFQKEQELA